MNHSTIKYEDKVKHVDGVAEFTKDNFFEVQARTQILYTPRYANLIDTAISVIKFNKNIHQTRDTENHVIHINLKGHITDEGLIRKKFETDVGINYLSVDITRCDRIMINSIIWKQINPIKEIGLVTIVLNPWHVHLADIANYINESVLPFNVVLLAHRFHN